MKLTLLVFLHHSYAFQIKHFGGSPFLTNRRVFAFADLGAPDGIKCDVYGNVWAGCGDGVNCWDVGGRLIGKILIPGGVANFCFGRDGEVFLCGETRLWRALLHDECRGALLDGEI
jgi:gluconolactonase